MTRVVELTVAFTATTNNCHTQFACAAVLPNARKHMQSHFEMLPHYRTFHSETMLLCWPARDAAVGESGKGSPVSVSTRSLPCSCAVTPNRGSRRLALPAAPRCPEPGKSSSRSPNPRPCSGNASASPASPPAPGAATATKGLFGGSRNGENPPHAIPFGILFLLPPK